MTDEEMARRVGHLEKQCEALANLTGLLAGVLRAQSTVSPAMEEWLFGAVRELGEGRSGRTSPDWDRAVTWAQQAAGKLPPDPDVWNWQNPPPEG
jgi:hypothetical protein